MGRIDETKCPVCGTPKKLLTVSDGEFQKILRENNVTDPKDLPELTKRIMKLSKYTYQCKCPKEKGWLIDKKRKEE